MNRAILDVVPPRIPCYEFEGLFSSLQSTGIAQVTRLKPNRRIAEALILAESPKREALLHDSARFSQS